MGLLMKCPQCSNTIGGLPCPNCHYSDKPADDAQDLALREDYRRRKELHVRNYAIWMWLLFALVADSFFLMIVGWFFRRRRWGVQPAGFGTSFELEIASLVLIVAWIGLAVAVTRCKRWFPTELNCPSCNVRLDELKLESEYCPGCNIKLW